ncbi:bifunctional acetaldehyde-CoA/alcohol dehydrogenase [Companilactobacillus mishanensis]|uniref:bifunctional acetaldehyde-CoA/alcohol dehydrogenase n=1 Tax=Companilactobacillus mishanensis TaxID=2486008 RepID=UPI001297409B|nr:bifunctional acetaldehyde-CoA/alcohol dehydrogenase [Companilactobacillus mishanensis]MQS88909.1 bifunctional acetaldehyde-CoA/alcohol dehydrogenase [Companilactobacillus mishanensis]
MLKENKKTTDEENVSTMIDGLVAKAHEALKIMDDYTQEQVDHIVHQMAIAGLNASLKLAKLAHEETDRGVTEDKVIKNMFATEEIWHSIKRDKTVGIIEDDKEHRLIKVAEPLGVLAGVTPVTNPTSTTLFKSLIAVKTRNPIIFGFHPQAQNCSVAAAKVMRDAAIAAGAPDGIIQWIEKPSLEATSYLINHDGVASVLATGGPGMVKAAYSTGKPALGVGPGNGPAYIEKTANIRRAVNDIVLSKTFDNGMVCASENSAIVDKDIYAEVKKEMEKNKVYFIKKSEHKALADAMFTPTGGVKGPIAGASALKIAKLAGIKIPEDTKVIGVEISEVGSKEPLSGEKLSPVISVYKSKDHAEAFKLADALLHYGGLGHTASIHTMDEKLATEYGVKMLASRVLVNTPSAIGGIGNLYNEMIPSLTLGTGSWGKNSISHNVSSFDLLNIKTIARRRNNMQWIKQPKVYFEKTSVRYLEDMEGIHRAFIVCDPVMVQLGYIDTILDELKRRKHEVEYSLFSDVEAVTSTDMVQRGVTQMNIFKPDTIISLGGGSTMDAAKDMWLFYEHPDVDLFGAEQGFIDIRKRTYKFPKPEKAQFVAIPTTFGTGGEVTPFSTITDSKTQVKYPIADYALTPDVAIIDSQFIESMPKNIVAIAGLEVLNNAVESFVSNMASDYTRPYAMQAFKLVVDNLQKAYNGDVDAMGELHNASTLAGMSFGNAFAGVGHSLADVLNNEFGVSHGLGVIISLPQVIRYNFKQPTKIAMWPKYEHFRADEDYAQIARYIGLQGTTNEELKEALITKIVDLAHSVGVKLSLKDNGIDKKQFDAKLEDLSELAFADQFSFANPKEPLIAELKQILIDEYSGKGIEK